MGGKLMAHKGTSAFVIQRATAALIIPLAIWLLIAVVSHLGAGLEEARAWAAHWWNATLIALFVVIGAVHMRIGMGEIIADYIHGSLKGVLNAFNWVLSIGVIAGALWAVYTLSFAG